MRSWTPSADRCGKSARHSEQRAPKLLTAAERLQYEGYLLREQTNAAIMALTKEGATIKEIVRRTGHSHGLVCQVLRGQRNDVFRSR